MVNKEYLEKVRGLCRDLDTVEAIVQQIRSDDTLQKTEYESKRNEILKQLMEILEKGYYT